MKQTHIDYRDLDFFSDLFNDYLAQKPELRKFYNYDFSLSAFSKVIEARKKIHTNRKILTEVLRAQSIDAAAPAIENINLLDDSNTFTITTGHQLNIFTGPLYFIYKIITVINTCRELKKAFPDHPFVPVYWMNSDDHDFEEISYARVFGKEIRWQHETKGPSGAVSTSSMQAVLDELFSMLGDTENALVLKRVFEESYIKHQRLDLAMRCLVNHLFGRYGLVILDPSHNLLKGQFKTILRDDIFHGNAYRLVNESSSQLSTHYKPQVNPRELNVFYMEENFRDRLVKVEKDGKVFFQVLNRDIFFSEQEINQLIEEYPEKLSPNVVLRPMYQEIILPNLAYIGGPSELAYWLEYKSMFDFYKVHFPMLIPRNSALWIDSSNEAKINKLGIPVLDLFLSTEQLIKKYVLEHAGDEIQLQDEAEEIGEIFGHILDKAMKIDMTLKATIEGERQKHIKSIQYVSEKILKAQKRKYEIDILQLQQLKGKLFPSGQLQERFDNFIPYYLKYGNSFFDSLLENFNPFESKFLVLEDQDKDEKK